MKYKHKKHINMSSRCEAVRRKSLKPSVRSPLRGGLSSSLLQLVAELLGVRVLHRLDGHRGLWSRFPLGAALVHHGGLHCHQVGAEDGEVQQELGAEVVVVRFYALLDLVTFSIQWNLNGK